MKKILRRLFSWFIPATEERCSGGIDHRWRVYGRSRGFESHYCKRCKMVRRRITDAFESSPWSEWKYYRNAYNKGFIISK